MKKILQVFIALFIIYISAMPTWAEGDVIIDRLTKSQAEELNIVIPNQTPPGFHSITIEVYDDNGVVKDKEIPFCKNLHGEIKWDNKCPDVTKLASLEALLKIKSRTDLPPYSPAQEPDKSSGLQITALAALAALAGAKKSKDSDSQQTSDSPDSDSPQQEELTSIESGKLENIEREIGRGDRSRTWQTPITSLTDYFFTATPLFFSHYSPLAARTFADGSYLRAMFGGYSLALAPIGLLLGVKSLLDTGAQALAPSLFTLLGILAVAILDASAGAVAAIIYFSGTLLSGGISSRSEALTVLGVMAIFIAPALLASAIRPLRRLVTTAAGSWERLTDYALAVLLTGWIVEKMVNALNGLSGVQLAVTYQARTIAIVASAFIFVRMVGEDAATYLYPQRLRQVTIELEEPTRLQKITSSVIKVSFFLLLATPYVGVNLQLILAGIIFVLPLIVNLTFVESLPKFSQIDWILPKATLKLVVLAIVGAIFGGYLQTKFTDPTAFLRWCFVLVAIPGLIISSLEWFADQPKKDWKSSSIGKWIYRIAGVLIYFLAVQIVRGFDFSTLLPS